jgi:hypothetical protein
MLFAAQAALEMAEVCARFFAPSPVPLNVVVWLKLAHLIFSFPFLSRTKCTGLEKQFGAIKKAFFQNFLPDPRYAKCTC